MAELL
ncbi:hypothetical protein OYC64_000721 [Pagothenia borchgrevinki]|jgi:hypothetical protein